jgi:thiamine kinase-like enzyme
VDLSVAEALAGIPGWENATARRLDGGLTNQAWLIDNCTDKAVLKIDKAPRGLPYNSRHDEARIQAAAAGYGLANRVLLATETLYLAEYVEGVVWSAESFASVTNIERFARALRQLHGLPLTGRTFDALGAARVYAARIGDPGCDKVGESLHVIESLSQPSRVCCCHNDLVAQNIISTPATRFLDWEYACDNDPFFDLATVVAHHDLGPTQRDLLLEAYCDGNGARWREHLACQVEVYAALLYLWERAGGA